MVLSHSLKIFLGVTECVVVTQVQVSSFLIPALAHTLPEWPLALAHSKRHSRARVYNLFWALSRILWGHCGCRARGNAGKHILRAISFVAECDNVYVALALDNLLRAGVFLQTLVLFVEGTILADHKLIAVRILIYLLRNFKGLQSALRELVIGTTRQIWLFSDVVVAWVTTVSFVGC